VAGCLRTAKVNMRLRETTARRNAGRGRNGSLQSGRQFREEANWSIAKLVRQGRLRQGARAQQVGTSPEGGASRESCEG